MDQHHDAALQPRRPYRAGLRVLQNRRDPDRERRMKGVIFGLLGDTVSGAFGDDSWDAILARAGTAGVYTSLGSYPDDELRALVDATAAVTGMTSPEVLRWFGHSAMPTLIALYPHFFAERATTRDLLLALNDIVHSEVRKLYPGAVCPHFHFRSDGDRLVIGYRSPRKLCRLAHGFIEGVAAHFDETIAITHLQCQHDGGPSCQMELRWLH